MDALPLVRIPLRPSSTNKRGRAKENLGDALSQTNFNPFEVLFLTHARQQVLAAA
jgi:hypothetical protein